MVDFSCEISSAFHICSSEQVLLGSRLYLYGNNSIDMYMDKHILVIDNYCKEIY